MTKARFTSEDNEEKVVWIKGNHQAALIDLNSLEELDRAPLFGTVNTYSENIPLLAAFHKGSWCGYYFLKNEFYLVWIEPGKQKEEKLLHEVIPEAKRLYFMKFDTSGKYLILLIGSARELSQSSLVLISIRFGSTFAMNDYYRLSETLPNFCPTITVAGDQWVLNKGTSIQAFRVEDGCFHLGLSVTSISLGRLS